MNTFKKFQCLAMIIIAGLTLARTSLAQTPDTRADFDNDGKADIVLYNRITGKAQIWYMNGTDLNYAKLPKDVVSQATGLPMRRCATTRA